MLSTYLYIKHLAGRSFGLTLSPEQTSAQTQTANSCQDRELFTQVGIARLVLEILVRVELDNCSLSDAPKGDRLISETGRGGFGDDRVAYGADECSVAAVEDHLGHGLSPFGPGQLFTAVAEKSLEEPRCQ